MAEVEVARNGAVQTITLNRPEKLNAFTQTLHAELQDALEQARVLREHLAKLKPTEREALVLRYVADLSHREIAEVLGVSLGTVANSLTRSLTRLSRADHFGDACASR